MQGLPFGSHALLRLVLFFQVSFRFVFVCCLSRENHLFDSTDGNIGWFGDWFGFIVSVIIE
jgi:hypothetical protein